MGFVLHMNYLKVLKFDNSNRNVLSEVFAVLTQEHDCLQIKVYQLGSDNYNN